MAEYPTKAAMWWTVDGSVERQKNCFYPFVKMWCRLKRKQSNTAPICTRPKNIYFICLIGHWKKQNKNRKSFIQANWLWLTRKSKHQSKWSYWSCKWHSGLRISPLTLKLSVWIPILCKNKDAKRYDDSNGIIQPTRV